MYRRAQNWTVLLVAAALVATLPLAGASPTARPEDVGMSSNRLQPLMIHTPAQPAPADFESAVAHAVVEPVPASLGTH